MNSTATKRIELEVKIKNPMGLHTRPATNIVRILQHAKCSVQFTYKKTTINAKSILSILTLAVPKNGKLIVVIDGDGAEDILPKLMRVLESPLEDISVL